MNPTNPFKKRKPRDVSTEDALSSVFDDPAVGEMMRRMTDSAEKNIPPPNLEVTDEIADKLAAPEKIAALKQRYLRWAESHLDIDNPVEWVDTTFVFSVDGARVEDDLNLSDKNLTALPPKLLSVGGSLYLSNNNLASLEGLGDVGGNLYLDYNNLTSLEGLGDVGGDLYLRDNNLTSLEGLGDVGGDLYLRNNTLTSLEGLGDVGGDLYLRNNTLTSLEGLGDVGGSLFLHNNPATEIPAGLKIGGSVCVAESQKQLKESAEAAGYTVEVL